MKVEAVPAMNHGKSGIVPDYLPRVLLCVKDLFVRESSFVISCAENLLNYVK